MDANSQLLKTVKISGILLNIKWEISYKWVVYTNTGKENIHMFILHLRVPSHTEAGIKETRTNKKRIWKFELSLGQKEEGGVGKKTFPLPSLFTDETLKCRHSSQGPLLV